MCAITSDLPGVSLTNNSEIIPIDLRSRREEISNFAQALIFKPREAGKHFNKHKTDVPFKVAQIDTAEKYITAAQTNIVNAIFEEGFVIRTTVAERVAFFTSDERRFPDKITSIGTFNGEGKLITFFSANNKTLLSTIKHFNGERAYIAYFKQGVSEMGWQKAGLNAHGMFQAMSAEVPGNDLDDSINFLKV